MQEALDLGKGRRGQKFRFDHAQQPVIDIPTARSHASANACPTVLACDAPVGALIDGDYRPSATSAANQPTE